MLSGTRDDDGYGGKAACKLGGEELDTTARARPAAPPGGAVPDPDLPEAMRIYDSMKARYGAAWNCTPEEWLRRFNACRGAGGGVIGCAALACASCHPE
jgi:hypothetical protein